MANKKPTPKTDREPDMGGVKYMGKTSKAPKATKGVVKKAAPKAAKPMKKAKKRG